jgi:hypothetical protein
MDSLKIRLVNLESIEDDEEYKEHVKEDPLREACYICSNGLDPRTFKEH